MDLAILVYAISILKPLSVMLQMMIVTSMMMLFITLMFYMSDYYIKDTTFIRTRRYCIVGLFIAAIGVIFIPSERTAYMMVSAYAAQKIATDPTVARLNEKVVKLIERKIDEYGAELPTPTAK